MVVWYIKIDEQVFSVGHERVWDVLQRVHSTHWRMVDTVGKAVDDTLCHQCVALLSVLAGSTVPIAFQTDAGGLELL